MRIALIGYGKMGKAIEQIALDKGHSCPFKITNSNKADLQLITPETADVAIEFTVPDAAVGNISTLLKNKVPVVCGTTGWLDELPKIEKLTKENNTAFFYASNFSVGVNIFFKLNKMLAKIMNEFKDYDVEMEEIHHIHKLDAPSGTAITLAEGVMENFKDKKQWSLDEAKSADDLKIVAKRIDEVPGTHVVSYNSPTDSIEIKHAAHNRTGFALGSVLSALWLKDKKGVFGMDDMLKL
jgi:4-hydroxy-tetrahydrodipicolinate reductase